MTHTDNNNCSTHVYDWYLKHLVKKLDLQTLFSTYKISSLLLTRNITLYIYLYYHLTHWYIPYNMYSLVPFRSVHIPTRCIVAQCCVCRIEEQVWSLLLTVIWRNVHQSVRVHNHFNINISSVLNKSFTVNKSFYVNISFHVNKSFTVNKSFNVNQIKNAIVYSLQSSVLSFYSI